MSRLWDTEVVFEIPLMQSVRASDLLLALTDLGFYTDWDGAGETASDAYSSAVQRGDRSLHLVSHDTEWDARDTLIQLAKKGNISLLVHMSSWEDYESQIPAALVWWDEKKRRRTEVASCMNRLEPVIQLDELRGSNKKDLLEKYTIPEVLR